MRGHSEEKTKLGVPQMLKVFNDKTYSLMMNVHINPC